MPAAGLPTYFFDQDFPETLAWFGALALLYAAIAVGVLALARRRLVSRRLVAAVVVALAVFVLALTWFEAGALYLRSVPHGYGAQRERSDYDDYLAAAKALLGGVYASALAFAALLGYVAGRRQAAAVVALVVLGFFVISFPAVEFENACNLGDGVVWDASC